VGPVSDSDLKTVFLRYLGAAREGLLWKLEGLSDYHVRRPLTPTGTNLLGIVKHVAMVESGYLGASFGRPVADPAPRFDPGDDTSDLWARADEPREYIVDFYARVAENSAATVDAVALAERGTVAHWPEERRHPTLAALLVHMVAETSRHAGHADIVRELIDGRAGMRPAATNLPEESDQWWMSHREKLQRVADGFSLAD
jgi:uncharacterized damage-inducible protein DinB